LEPLPGIDAHNLIRGRSMLTAGLSSR